MRPSNRAKTSSKQQLPVCLALNVRLSTLQIIQILYNKFLSCQSLFIKALTTSPEIISPAQAGTNAIDAGTWRPNSSF